MGTHSKKLTWLPSPRGGSFGRTGEGRGKKRSWTQVQVLSRARCQPSSGEHVNTTQPLCTLSWVTTSPACSKDSEGTSSCL